MNDEEKNKDREAAATEHMWNLALAASAKPTRVDRIPGDVVGGLRYDLRIGPRRFEVYARDSVGTEPFAPSVFVYPGLTSTEANALHALLPSLVAGGEKPTPDQESALAVLIGIHPGTDEEATAFAGRHPVFMDHLGELGGLANLAVSLQPKHMTGRAADELVAGYLKLCMEDFAEILTLCMNGFGIGGLKLLRPMYERAVTAVYVHKKPTAADKLFEYAAIQSGKHSKRVRSQMAAYYPPDWIAMLDKSIAAYEATKDKFEVPECRKCAKTGKCQHKRTAFSWGPTIEEMALKDPAMRSLYIFCYSDPLFHSHATLMSLTSRLRRVDGTWLFDRGPQREKADMVLMHAHLVLLGMVALQRDHFGLNRLSEPLLRCKRKFHEIWTTMGYPTEALGSYEVLDPVGGETK